MSTDNKIMVVAKEGMALVGTAFHELKAQLFTTFKTNNIKAFAEYLKDSSKSKGTIFFDEKKITAYPPEDAVSYEIRPIAECTPNFYPEIKLLVRANGQQLSFNDAELLLTTLRENCNKEAMTVLDFCINGNVNKIVNMKRTKDHSGNMTLNISRESGKDDFTCPKTVSFKVPVFEHTLAESTLIFDVFLSFKESDENCEVKIMLRNLNLTNQLEKIAEGIVTQELEDIAWPKYWGSVVIEKVTDAWRFKEHPIQ